MDHIEQAFLLGFKVQGVAKEGWGFIKLRRWMGVK